MGYYLMIKTINETGLKYLCKCTDNKGHISYKGSGKYWKRVLKKHPEYTISTQILGWFETNDDLSKVGLEYSKKFNIIESNEWANLMYETGDGGDSILGRRKVYDPINDVESHLPNSLPLPEGWVEGGRRRGPRPKWVTEKIVKAQKGILRPKTSESQKAAWARGRKPIPRKPCSKCNKMITAPNLKKHERVCNV